MAVEAIWKSVPCRSRTPYAQTRNEKVTSAYAKRVLGALRTAILSACLVVACLSATSSAPVFHQTLPEGLDFALQNSPTSRKYLIETMPGGVALLDYNSDGLLDIF